MAAGKIVRQTKGVATTVYNRKKTNRKQRKKYRSFKPRVLTLPWGQHTGFPEKMMVRLKYVDSHSLGDNINPMASFTYRCNSIFDPNFTGGGHQPLYHDQFALIYQNYKVTKMSIRLRALSTQGAANSNIFYGIDNIGSDTTVDINPNTIRERPGSIYKTLTPQAGSMIKSGWNIKKSAVNGEDGYTAAFGSNPTNVDYIRFYVCSADGTALPTAIAKFNAEIIYTVELFNLVSVFES